MKKLFIFSLVGLLGLTSCENELEAFKSRKKIIVPTKVTGPASVVTSPAPIVEPVDQEGFELWQVQLTATPYLELVSAKVYSYDLETIPPYRVDGGVIYLFMVAMDQQEAVSNARAFCRVNDVIPGI